MNIHHNLEAIKDLALHHASEWDCNYNVIISNPLNGEYNFTHGSTYEFVTDSYLVSRPETVIIMKTKDVLQPQQKDRGQSTQEDKPIGRSGVGTSIGIAGYMGNFSLLSASTPKELTNKLDRLPELREVPNIVIDSITDLDYSFNLTSCRGLRADNSKFYDRFYNKKYKR